jgi:hypothetical protein
MRERVKNITKPWPISLAVFDHRSPTMSKTTILDMTALIQPAVIQSMPDFIIEVSAVTPFQTRQQVIVIVTILLQENRVTCNA